MGKRKEKNQSKDDPSFSVKVESDQELQKTEQKQSRSASAESNLVMIPQVETKAQLGGVQLSPFWKNRPKLWFIQLEYQFVAYGVRSDDAKLGVVLRHLDEESVFSIADELEQPPESNKYEYVKTALIRKYSKSLKKQLTKLLQEIEMGNNCPSSLLQEMRTVAESNVTDNNLRKLWLQKLDKPTQDILVEVQNSMTLDQLARFADLVVKKTVVANMPDSSNNTDAIKVLTEQVEELKNTLKADKEQSEIDADTIKQLKAEVTALRGIMEQVAKRGSSSSSHWENWKIWAS